MSGGKGKALGRLLAGTAFLVVVAGSATAGPRVSAVAAVGDWPGEQVILAQAEPEDGGTVDPELGDPAEEPGVDGEPGEDETGGDGAGEEIGEDGGEVWAGGDPDFCEACDGEILDEIPVEEMPDMEGVDPEIYQSAGGGDVLTLSGGAPPQTSARPDDGDDKDCRGFARLFRFGGCK